jgi:chemotaxis protein CheD
MRDDNDLQENVMSPEGEYFLNPGHIIITSRETPVVTILGSCVAITVYSPEKKTGAMFHAVLPEHRDKKIIISNAPPVSPDPDYVDYAYYYIFEKFRQKGINFRNTRLMLFGGGDVIRSLAPAGKISIGLQNINMIKKIIHSEGLSLHAEDTGGEKGRKVIFYPHTGKVYLEYIKSTDNN